MGTQLPSTLRELFGNMWSIVTGRRMSSGSPVKVRYEESTVTLIIVKYRNH